MSNVLRTRGIFANASSMVVRVMSSLRSHLATSQSHPRPAPSRRGHAGLPARVDFEPEPGNVHAAYRSPRHILFPLLLPAQRAIYRRFRRWRLPGPPGRDPAVITDCERQCFGIASRIGAFLSSASHHRSFAPVSASRRLQRSRRR